MARSVKQKDINFLTVLTGRKSRKRVNPRTFIMPGVMLLIILVGVGTFASLQNSILQIKDESQIIREYLNAPETNQKLSEAATIKAQAESMASLAEKTAAPMENLATYPDLTSAQYLQILEYAGYNIELSTMTFDRTTGLLSFTATSDYVFSIPTFISQLRNSGIFTDVSYSGYSSNVAPTTQLATSTPRAGDTATGGTSVVETITVEQPMFSFRVECSVKPVTSQPEPAPDEPEEGEEG